MQWRGWGNARCSACSAGDAFTLDEEFFLAPIYRLEKRQLPEGQAPSDAEGGSSGYSSLSASVEGSDSLGQKRVQIEGSRAVMVF